MTPDEQLSLFRCRADELTRLPVIKNGFNPGVTIQWDRMSGLRFERREPDEDRVRSLVLLLRQFISDGVPIYIGKIYNVLHQRLKSEELKGYIANSRDAWKQACKALGVKLDFRGGQLTPEHIADLWFNGHYFHSDEDKTRELWRLDPVHWIFARSVFMAFLVEIARQVLYVANLIITARREGLIAP